MNDYVQATEAGRILDVSSETVRRWQRDGILPAMLTSRGVRFFSRSAVEALARQRSHEHPRG